MNVRRMRREDADFHRIMGPYLSRREIVRELGSPVWDDAGKVWYIALDDDVLGFAACIVRRARLVWCSDYVRPRFRGRGVYRALFEARLADLPKGATVESAVTAASLQTYLRHGFSVVGRRGRYALVRKRCET